MVTWAEFEAAAPEMAAEGGRLLDRGGAREALLATVMGDAAPRIHPINIGIVDGRLYAFLLRSAKRRDLAEDGRYALHSHQDPDAPSEFLVRGRAVLIESDDVRAAAGATWPFDVDASYWLFEFSVDTAVLGLRPTADDWPPIYSTWAADPA
jgi:Pyridoxamine 5'-phosphate oxidase